MVLPAPLGPVTSISSPGETVMLISLSTAVLPNDFVTRVSLTTGAGAKEPLVPGPCAASTRVVVRAPLVATVRYPTPFLTTG